MKKGLSALRWVTALNNPSERGPLYKRSHKKRRLKPASVSGCVVLTDELEKAKQKKCIKKFFRELKSALVPHKREIGGVFLNSPARRLES